MDNKKYIIDLIDKSKDIENKFEGKDINNITLPESMRKCSDVKSLSQWVYESLIVINRLKGLNDKELCVHFKKIYDNVEAMHLDEFQVLIGILKAIISKWQIEEEAEKNTVNFYDAINEFNNSDINY